MMYYECDKCKKRFISEELVKTNLQWFHNITPRELFEGLKQVKKQIELDENCWHVTFVLGIGQKEKEHTSTT